MDTKDTSTLYAISPNGLRLHVGWDYGCKAYTYHITDLIGDLMLNEAPAKHRHESIEPVRALGLNALRSLEGTHNHNFEGAFIREVAYRKAKDVAGFDKHGVGSKKFFETVSKARVQSDKEALRYCQSLIDASASTLPSTKPIPPRPSPNLFPESPTDNHFTFAKTPCGTISATWMGDGSGEVVVWDHRTVSVAERFTLPSLDNPFREIGALLRLSGLRSGGFNDNPLYTSALSSCDTQHEREFLIWEVCKALAFGEVWAEEICRGHLAFSKAALGKRAVNYARTPKSINMGLELTSTRYHIVIDRENAGEYSTLGRALSDGWGKLWGAEGADKGHTPLTASPRYKTVLSLPFRLATQLPRDLIIASDGELVVPVSFKALSMRRVNGDDKHVLDFMEAIIGDKPLPAYPVPPGAAPVTTVPQAEAKPEPTPAEWARLYTNLKMLKDKAPHLFTPELAKRLAEAREKRIAPLPGAEWIEGKGPLHGKVPRLK